MPVSIRWSGTLTALSSITQGGETRGTLTLLRREKVVQPNGRLAQIPIISGNSFRGKLRRIAEDLLREVLKYDGQIDIAAAHALRGGGALRQTSGQPLSGEVLREVRARLPLVGVFGCAAGGRVIDGCLQVGKVYPHYAELGPILSATGTPPAALRQLDATQIETFIRQDDADSHGFPAPAARLVPIGADGLPATVDPPPSNLMLYEVETYPAGSKFSTWLSLSQATALETAFFTDVLAAWTRDAHLGGRTRTGHGRVHPDLRAEITRGQVEDLDWRVHLTEHRDAALAALTHLT